MKSNTLKRAFLIALSLALFFSMTIPAYADTSSFKKGDKSDEIAKAQTALKKLGFFDEVCTGYFGDVTEGAVLKFQRKHGLDDDGVLGFATISRLNELAGEHISVPSRSLTTRKDTTKVNVRYKIKSGDTIWDIASDYNVSVDSILEFNGLNEKSILKLGAEIIIPNVVKVVKPSPAKPAEVKPEASKPEAPVQDSSELENIYDFNKNVYVVKEGDTIESIAEDYGVTAEAIQRENNFSSDTALPVGQEIKIPEGSNMNTEEVAKDESGTSVTKGEYLDWFKEVQYIFDKEDKAVVTDLDTGKSFNIKRLYGRNHADVEPLTTEDTKIMKSIYGGEWSWDRRAVIVTLYDKDKKVERKIAGSMNGMPHGGQSIKTNGFKGQFCIHFKNSRTHSGNRWDTRHQNAVKKAAGLL